MHPDEYAPIDEWIDEALAHLSDNNSGTASIKPVVTHTPVHGSMVEIHVLPSTILSGFADLWLNTHLYISDMQVLKADFFRALLRRRGGNTCWYWQVDNSGLLLLEAVLIDRTHTDLTIAISNLITEADVLFHAIFAANALIQTSVSQEQPNPDLPIAVRQPENGC